MQCSIQVFECRTLFVTTNKRTPKNNALALSAWMSNTVKNLIAMKQITQSMD